MIAKRFLLGVVAAGLVLALLPRSAAADGPKGTAVIKGKVVLEGDPGKTGVIPVNKDQFCQNAHAKTKKKVPDQGTIIYKGQGNAVPYAFVYVKNIKDRYDPPKDAALIDQKGCVYYPHVFGMVAGQELHIKSSDPTAHNIHALPKKNSEFNISQPKMGVLQRKGAQTFTRPEMAIKIKCDVHPWMNAWCHVMPHPFFDVTVSHESDGGDKSKRGCFEIKELPAGEYEIVAWHEKLGTVSQKVKVGDGETKEIEVKMSKKSASAAQPSRTILASSVQSGDASSDTMGDEKAAVASE
ncbi:MAG: hypothetical protein MI923_11475 [Phycisphaerales bacterium]|nr:hypothetical protein [Phycisphaerales bacterium]